jgi:hypothetical protein
VIDERSGTDIALFIRLTMKFHALVFHHNADMPAVNRWRLPPQIRWVNQIEVSIA